MSELKITKGLVSAHSQKGTPGHCIMAQVFDEEGKALVFFEPTEDESEATANANLYADAHNTANKFGKLPSQPLLENTEMLEALKEALDNAEYEESDAVQGYVFNKYDVQKLKELIQKIESK